MQITQRSMGFRVFRNFIILSLVTSGIVNTGVFAGSLDYPGCGAPKARPCSDFYSRLQALKRLMAVENSTTDAEANLDLIEEAQKQTEFNLEYLTDNFIFLQSVYGGPSLSRLAQSTFKTEIRAYLSLGRKIELLDLATALVQLSRIENSDDQALGNFELVVDAAASKNALLFYEFLPSFQQILSRVGSGATDTARSMFIEIAGTSYRFSSRDLTQSLLSLVSVENSYDQALENFQLVVQAAMKCGSVDVATRDFIEALQTVGGSRETAGARALYIKLYKL